MARTQAVDRLLLDRNRFSRYAQRSLQPALQVEPVFRQSLGDPISNHVDGGEVAAERVMQLACKLGLLLFAPLRQSSTNAVTAL